MVALNSGVRGPPPARVVCNAVEYGIERLNSEVAAWMRGDDIADGNKAHPPFLAMG